MKKSDILFNNSVTLGFLKDLERRWKEKSLFCYPVDRLRTCNARVVQLISVNDGTLVYVLISYNTPVALIFNDMNIDFLRYSYGYTATSAQHISKFFADYGEPDAILYRYYKLD